MVVDVQLDLLPGGANPVPNGHRVLEPLFRIYPLFRNLVIAILTFHPRDPALKDKRYCVINTDGAEYPENLLAFFMKGRRESVFTMLVARNHNGGFASDGKITELLNRRRFRRVFLSGLTLDGNIQEVALKLKNAGFEVVVLEDAVRSRDLQVGAAAKQNLQLAGIQFQRTSEFFKE